ncbi:MAG: ABC transporter substrate-binding protein [Butyrivibrio sp.]|nr:ABC transporter substrate-binding protein [Butyrivibrio sp.]
MRKKILSLLLALVLAVSFTACGKSSGSGKTDGCDINIASLKGPTSIGLVKLFDDSDNGKTVNKYHYSIHGTADEISTGIIKGDFDVAAVPCNLASVLYNKSNGEIVIAGINTLGVLYILEKGVEISSVADLKGQTIYTTGQGTTPEYTLRYLLSAGGLDPDKDVTIEFRSEASEVVSAVSQLDSAVMMLPQPYVTVAQSSDENIKVALDVTAEWEKLDKDSTVVTGVLIARKAFIEEHPKEFETFLSEYKTSAAYANDSVDDTAALLEKFDIFKAAVAKKAIPQCGVTFITGSEMQSKVLSYLSVLFDANPASVGGNMPDENIFYGTK